MWKISNCHEICHGVGYQHDLDDNELNEIFGVLKKSAKASPNHIACVDLGVINHCK